MYLLGCVCFKCCIVDEDESKWIFDVCIKGSVGNGRALNLHEE